MQTVACGAAGSRFARCVVTITQSEFLRKASALDCGLTMRPLSAVLSAFGGVIGGGGVAAKEIREKGTVNTDFPLLRMTWDA